MAPEAPPHGGTISRLGKSSGNSPVSGMSRTVVVSGVLRRLRVTLNILGLRKLVMTIYHRCLGQNRL